MQCSKISILKTNKSKNQFSLSLFFFFPDIYHLGSEDLIRDDEDQNHSERKQWACGNDLECLTRMSWTWMFIASEGNHLDSILCNMLSDDPVWAENLDQMTHCCPLQPYPFCDSVSETSHVLSASEQLWLHLQQIFGDLVDCLKTRSWNWVQDNLAVLSSECHLLASWPMQYYPASSPKSDSCVGVINARELPEAGRP